MYDDSEPFEVRSSHAYPNSSETEQLQVLFSQETLEGRIVRAMIMGGNLPVGTAPQGLSVDVLERMNRKLAKEGMSIRVIGEPSDRAFENQALFWVRPV